jgi:isoleucyl-tRNA synthetase
MAALPGASRDSVFASVPENIRFPEIEDAVLQHWSAIDAFQTSLKKSEGRPVYTFYDGPPFATGMPHYGHILAGTIKVLRLCVLDHQKILAPTVCSSFFSIFRIS